MKVISTVVNPIPDHEGYHLMKCNHCGKFFLINPKDLNVDDAFFCPYCSEQGNLMTFTELLCKEKLDIPFEEAEKVAFRKNVDIEKIEEFFDSLDADEVDIDIVEYRIDEFLDENDLMEFEFICCDRFIKIPYEDYKDIKYCPMCKGEVMVNNQ